MNMNGGKGNKGDAGKGGGSASTKPCQLFLQGMCRFGSECRFHHAKAKGKCHSCGGDHMVKDCPRKKAAGSSSASGEADKPPEKLAMMMEAMSASGRSVEMRCCR